MRILLFLLTIAVTAVPAHADRLMPGEPLTRERLETLIMADLGVDRDDRRLDIRIHQPALPMANRARSPMTIDLIDLTTNAETGMFDARVSARLESGEHSLIGIKGRIEEMLPVVVPTRTHRRGETLTAREFEIRFEPSSRLREGVVESVALVDGKESRKPLRRDQPVYAADLIEPRLIRQGEIVEVVFKAPGLELAAFAEALDEGAAGEIVRLANLDSGKRFRAIVTDYRKAVIASSPMGVHR